MSDISFADEHVAARSPSEAAPVPVLFTGDNGEFRRLVTRGALLELVTAGFYRFWLATNIRRHLWSSTVIGGDALEYVGTARELLFGFFFALAILAPVYIAYIVIGFEAERQRAFASLPLGLFFAAFGQFAIYRARRYRLNRSAWRGLRFGMGGSGLAYMFRAIGWGLLIALTLGLALPWAEAALERYKMRHTYYGALEGGFVGRGGDFFKRAGWIWFTALILLLSPYVIGAVFRGPIWILAGVIYVIGAPALFAAFKAEQWRWWLRGLRLGGARLETRLTMSALLGNYFAFLGVLIGVLIAAAIVFGIVVATNRNAMVGTTPPIGVLIPIVLAYVATFLSIGVASRIFLMQRVWKLVASSLVVHGLAEAEDVATRASIAPSAIGEGFADSLDVVGF
ncbi:YjgN family protein [Methylosinus sporium]|uniref:YjgN family protein n=1 Tax=Methylosinus sporium TaxID=428 RepID=UPI003839E26F